ncbi:citrate lyase acyl carrier protein [uncultured Ilyobacter sp.]|jgi:citrate lyase subunit gamma (acyl carrier protein)|uniref:citrate lyase acyl carrier protein n=1 Tax=uncultured Ilyobacter sp. TaxID=544433 RepID=UPI002AA79E66|nr:citrate lyase acyl carrier protein [uncultured Ilyobacter sp.]
MIGICGNEKASDALVTVDLNTVGISVEVISKLKGMFGDLMKKSVMEALAEMETENAKVTVQDFGALDFIIKARTKTAVRRAMAAAGGVK